MMKSNIQTSPLNIDLFHFKVNQNFRHTFGLASSEAKEHEASQKWGNSSKSIEGSVWSRRLKPFVRSADRDMSYRMLKEV